MRRNNPNRGMPPLPTGNVSNTPCVKRSSTSAGFTGASLSNSSRMSGEFARQYDRKKAQAYKEFFGDSYATPEQDALNILIAQFGSIEAALQAMQSGNIPIINNNTNLNQLNNQGYSSNEDDLADQIAKDLLK